MGIKGFSAWLKQAFPHVFCSLPNGQVLHFDQVFVDLNPFLHMAARISSASSNDEVWKNFNRTLRGALTKIARPVRMVYVSIDGPAPLAKLPQQRLRRQESAVNAVKRASFDAQHFTPGCLAMTFAESQIYSLLQDLFFKLNPNSSSNGKRSSSFSAIIDGACVEGEGEFKIIRKIVQNHIDCDAFEGEVSRAILALDSDLFLLALLSDVPRLYLIDPFAGNGSPTACFSVDRWKRALTDFGQGTTGVDDRFARNVSLDFAFLALMSGSDYAPAIRYANYRSLWPIYREFRLGLSPQGHIVDADSKSVNMQFLKSFLAFYLKRFSDSDKIAFLNAYHDSLSPSDSSERILNYVEHLIWNLDALIDCKVVDLSISLLEDKSAPSIIELVEMDAVALQSALNDRIKERAVPTASSHEQKLPGAIALMALDLQSECDAYIAEPLRPILRELREPDCHLLKLSDSELAKTLSEKINNLSVEKFSLHERLSTFPRSAIQIPSHDNRANNTPSFYEAAVETKPLIISCYPDLQLPWLRPYVYKVDEESVQNCSLGRILFGSSKVEK